MTGSYFYTRSRVDPDQRRFNPDSPDWEEEALGLVNEIACIPAVYHIGEDLSGEKEKQVDK